MGPRGRLQFHWLVDCAGVHVCRAAQGSADVQADARPGQSRTLRSRATERFNQRPCGLPGLSLCENLAEITCLLQH